MQPHSITVGEGIAISSSLELPQALCTDLRVWKCCPRKASTLCAPGPTRSLPLTTSRNRSTALDGQYERRPLHRQWPARTTGRCHHLTCLCGTLGDCSLSEASQFLQRTEPEILQSRSAPTHLRCCSQSSTHAGSTLMRRANERGIGRSRTVSISHPYCPLATSAD